LWDLWNESWNWLLLCIQLVCWIDGYGWFFLWFVEYIEGIIWIKAFYKYVIFHDDGSEKRDLEGIIGMNNPF